MKEQEVTLTEAELSDVKNSIATLCKKYIAGSFFDKLVDSSGIKIAKDILMADLKEMIGHGTSAPAAKKFATAVLTAKSTPAVDTILANYMLKGDGMGAGIGYNESTAVPVQSFQQFLSESRKAEKIDAKPSQEMIDEAIKTVEAEGYKVNKIEGKSESNEAITKEQINEAIEVAKQHGYRVITRDQIEEAKKVVEAKGFKVIDESEKAKSVNESKSAELYIPVYDYDVDELLDLIRFSIQNTDAPTFLRNKFGVVSFDADGSNVIVELLDSRDAAKSLRNLIGQYIENSTGIEAEFDEDLLDYYPILLKKSRIEEK